MPYTVTEENGKYCVYKKGEDGKPEGKSLGEHDSKPEAEKQIAAIEANEANKMVAPDHFEKFVQLEKVDAAKGQVWGILSSETPDKAGEIIDYEHSKPNFIKWSDDMQKASGGKSKGNLRAMHGGQIVAAGKIIHFEARDDTKDFYIGAQVVDPIELEKVYSGVYTGFSVGGSYGPWRQADGKYLRREGKPVEASLVDVPCNPDSTFQFVKADGAVEMRKFATVEDTPESTPAAPDPVEDPKPEPFDELLAKADPATLQTYMEKLQKAIQPEEPKKDNQPAAPAAEDKGGQTAQEPAPADDGKAVVPPAEEIRGMILSILEELGLVVKEGEAMKAVVSTDMQKSTEALDLAKADFAKQKDELSKAISDGDKALAGDIAQLIAANEDMAKRVEKVTGMGPVVMVQGASAPEQAAQLEVEVLKKYQASATNPAEAARFGELIAAAEIKTIHKQ